MFARRAFAAIIGSCVFFGVVHAVADESDSLELSSGPLKERILTLVMAVRSSRQMIHSGEYSAKFRFVEAARQGAINYEIFSAWDVERQLLRFDYLRPRDGRIGRFISREDCCWFETGDGSINRFAAGWTPDEYLFRPFDVRILGVAPWAAFQHRVTLEFVFADWLDAEQWHAFSEKNGEARLVLRRRLKNAISEDEIVIDTVHGFTPVERHWRARNLQNPEDVISRNSVNVVWREFDGVWVPEQVDMSASADNFSAAVTVAFDWKCVNCVVDSSRFDENKLDLPPETFVVDYTVNENVPIVVGRMGKSEAEITKFRKPRSRKWPVLLMAVNGLLVLLILVLAWWRWVSRC